MLPSLSLVERVVSPPGQEDHQALILLAVIHRTMVMAVPRMVMVMLVRSSTTPNLQANPVSRPKKRNRNPLLIKAFENITEAVLLGLVRLVAGSQKKDYSY